MASPGMVSGGGVKAGDPALGGSTTPLAQPGHISLKPLLQVRDILVEMFVNRESEILAVLTALISGEPAILIGPPGTAKTSLIETLAKLVNAKYFYYLLTRFTEPDELLGPLDINALREGRYVRITTNRLPEAEIVFLDEIFKASSAIRNILLDIILNKRYLNGAEYRELPMLALYTASNEISTDTEDAAFYDRLVIRSFVRELEESDWPELIVKGVTITANKRITPIMDADYVRELRKIVVSRVQEIAEDETFRSKIVEALALLKAKGLKLSSRRIVKLVFVTSAISIVYAEQQPSLDSLADALRFVAPHSEDDLQKVEDVIIRAKISHINAEIINKVMMLKTELQNMIVKVRDENVTKAELKALVTLVRQTIEFLKILEKNPRAWRFIKELKTLIREADMLLTSLR